MSIAIEVKNLSKVYTIYENPVTRLKDALGFSGKNHGTDFYALDHINLTVEKGKTLGIIGENGAGKSTLLKIITGVLSPTDGEVILHGRVSALLELGAGFNPEYTGMENIYLNGRIMGLSREEVDAKLQDILDFADIGDFIHQKVKTYSSGMFARLAFAVAINVEPEILIIDEALAVGDLFFQHKCNMFMKEKMKHCTKILVTHDMSTIANMADEAIVLSKGKQVFCGDPLSAIEFYTKKAHTELFQGKMSQDILAQTGEPEMDKEIQNKWTMVKEESLGGALEAKIEGFCLLVNGEAYKGYVQSGDRISVDILLSTRREIDNLIIGYQMKDKYGNIIFGENTHSSGFLESRLKSDRQYIASLSFRWPEIQANEYLLTLGLGEGTHEMQHIVQCWAHSIFEFKNVTKLPNHGLFNQAIESYQITEV